MASRKSKGFFALDVDQFERAADLGLEPATAYLALMAGTDQTNTVSAWGIFYRGNALNAWIASAERGGTPAPEAA